MKPWLFFAALAVWPPCLGWSQAPTPASVAPAVKATESSAPVSAAETAIRAVVTAYVEAYNSRDAKALAAFWSPEAVYTIRTTGEEVVGREAIAAQFAATFQAQPAIRLDVQVTSLQLLSPNAAVEHGTAKILVPDTEPEVIGYTAIYVQREGKWLLDRVTDEALEVVPSQYEQLKVLEWMVGTWIDQDESVQIETECHWTKNQSFLVRSYTVVVGDSLDMSGIQIIGWDAAVKGIRSWTFDSDGGFAEGRWTKQDDRWFINNRGVLADGRKATMVNIMKPVDENHFTWQTVERTAGGELLPNIDAVIVVRE